ncbi:MAG TPA: 50S ribosomal protein L24 [Thermomicrobiales bacterium]|jgi:large subunit ribosomal protein L24|nr:50S ribosomal protein L24 [Chloroflexota bacterium]HBY46506.1 50S ribosomal protein L24 [Chloroflexota bacterium]HCG30016.1 50S ribosomal protein L24 [Chloroflexota bacterium]HQZ89552.1 50S ribosomal protein L24 [Thermomicrobiales bacterium]HRA31133.1 50S ribosomal protein L24 [Thermomicrobiales bacterium]
MAEKIVTGDEIVVISGKNKGERARVRQNMPREDKVVIEGVNIVRKHIAQGRARQAGIVEVEAPLRVSKVMLVCPSCGEPTRVGFRMDDSGNKVRYCKKCDAVVPKPTSR